MGDKKNPKTYWLYKQLHREFWVDKDLRHVEKKIELFMSAVRFKYDESTSLYKHKSKFNISKPENWAANARIEITKGFERQKISVTLAFGGETPPKPGDTMGSKPPSWVENYWNTFLDDFQATLNTDKEIEFEHMKFAGAIEEVSTSGCFGYFIFIAALIISFIVFIALLGVLFPGLSHNLNFYLAIYLSFGVYVILYYIHKKYVDKKLGPWRSQEVNASSFETNANPSRPRGESLNSSENSELTPLQRAKGFIFIGLVFLTCGIFLLPSDDIFELFLNFGTTIGLSFVISGVWQFRKATMNNR